MGYVARLIGLLLPFVAGPAFAQCGGVFPAYSLCANLTGVAAPPKATSALTFPSLEVDGSFIVNDATNGVLGTSSDRTSIIFNAQTDLANVGTGFTDATGQIFNWVTTYGDHSSGFSAPNGKTTFAPIRYSISGPAAGQKLAMLFDMNCAGAGDCLGPSMGQTYYGGVGAAGDEGSQGFNLAVEQPRTFFHIAITSVTTGGGNTTSTQAITGSYIAQTVTVASSTGFTVGEWVNVNQASNPTTLGGGLSEAVRLTGVASGTLTGAFRLSQPNGVTITPATVLTMTNSGAIGQHRYAVNLSASSYSTGTATFVDPNYIGVGTTWTNTMVGGDAGRPGCLAMAGDVISGVNRQTWNAIQTINSTTSLATQVAGFIPWDAANTSYVVRPCGLILRVNPNTPSAGLMQVILESNAFTWTVSDDIEFPAGPGFGTIGHKVDLYSYFPRSGNIGLQVVSYGPVAPTRWINLLNSGSGLPPLNNGVNNTSYFIFADTSGNPGAMNYFARVQGVGNLLTASISSGGDYQMDKDGIYTTLHNTDDCGNSRGSGPAACSLELDPTWNSPGKGQTLIGAYVTDTASAASSNLIDLWVGASRFSVRKDGLTTIAGDLKISTAAKTLTLKRGANGAVGTFICTSGGTITVSNTNVAVTDAITISLNTAGGTISTTPAVKTITAATGFEALCATNDTATYNYALIKNAS